jgi:hypothetical protein
MLLRQIADETAIRASRIDDAPTRSDRRQKTDVSMIRCWEKCSEVQRQFPSGTGPRPKTRRHPCAYARRSPIALIMTKSPSLRGLTKCLRGALALVARRKLLSTSATDLQTRISYLKM